MTFTFSEAIAQPPTFTQTKGIDIVGKTGIEASSTQFNEALTDGSFLVLNSKSYTGTGAGFTLDTTKYLHLITTSASNEQVTVPDGTYVGQTMLIVLELDGGGDLSLVVPNALSVPPPPMNDTAESTTLVWTGSKWCYVSTMAYTA